MKKLVIIICFGLTGISVFSQKSLGIVTNAGVSFNHGTMFQNLDYYTHPAGPHINIGMVYHHAISDLFSFGLKPSFSGELLFYKVDITNGNLYANENCITFNTPIFIQLNIHKFSIDLGVQPELFLYSYHKYRWEIDNEMPETFVNSRFLKNLPDILDLGIYSAVSYNYNEKLSFEVSYHNGLLSGRSLMPEYNFTTSTISTGVKYFFGK